MHSYQLTVYNVKISKCDNSLMTAQRQSIIVGAKQRSALANYIRPKQRLSTPTVKGREKRKKHRKQCHFCYFCNLTLVNLPTSQLVYSKNKVTQ